MGEESRYYEEELTYLVEAGREYARLHPDRARYLNLSDPRARDPHVERLIEAFAFLAGSVRRRLDDDFPQLTTALIDLVWPHLMRPTPSLCLLEFRPIPGMVRERQTIERGFLVDSQPTSTGVPCRFATCYPVDVLPLRLEDAGIVTDDAGQRLLRLRLSVIEGADPAAFTLDRLRIHLFGEPTVAATSYKLLRAALKSVRVRFSREKSRLLPPSAVRPVGFADGDELLSYPAASFPGYRLLSEYFAFREKFLFFDVAGIGALELPRGESSFELDFRFTERPPDTYRPTRDEFRLFVTPAVNLFPRDGEPILVTHERQAYRVLGDYTHPDAVEVVSVDDVQSLGRRSGARRELEPFYSFAHDEGDGSSTYYHVSYRTTDTGGWMAHLSLIAQTPGALPEEQTLSPRLTCSNGRLCREVGIDSIRVAAEKAPDFATFRNITRPTDPILPRLGEGAAWDLVSHLALNMLSLTDSAALRRVLSLYDQGDRSENRRRIEAVRHVVARPAERLLRGTAVRGTALELTLDEASFAGEGDVLLFRDVLTEFLALYAATNSFVQLTVIRSPSGEVLRCPPLAGRQSLL